MSGVSFFDVFSGIGGFRLGLERLGWRCYGHCEIDGARREVYRRNFQTAVQEDNYDIAELDYLEGADVLVGGFPCQSFSMAGKRRGFSDARGQLFLHLPRLLSLCRPKAFLFENVKGLRMTPSAMVEVVSSLKRTGYAFDWAVLDSSMFGPPQKRERLYFVGFRDGIPKGFVFPKGERNGSAVIDVMEAQVEARYYAPAVIVRSTEFLLPPFWRQRARAIVSIGRHSPKEYGGWGLVLSPFGLSPTLVPGLDQRGQPLYLIEDGTTLRRLTPREWARLQAFPDSFRLPEDDARAYRYLGDSVTTTVIEAIGVEMEKWLA
ncbi:MAG: DNA (cytosine-5-)-methyltransferase [Nitrososphaerota archaeon]|nr:DNA (cytosine-5-)-methyltransferase [Nitrososphaerota archaeon]